MARTASPPSKRLSKSKLLARIEAGVKKRARARATRRAKFTRKRPIPNFCLVVWVDLLGFREQISEADTPEKFLKAYRRIRKLHEEFDKETASAEPDQKELNLAHGKRIVALSDGLVIALNLENDVPVAAVSSLHERIGFFLESLRLAQARLAYAGDYLRGGIAMGYFWFDDDILLSPGLVEAYQMESKKAKNPAIIIPRELADAVQRWVVGEGYSEGSEPMRDLFRSCEWMSEDDYDSYVMLNFMPMFLDDDDPVRRLKKYVFRLREAHLLAPDKAKSKYDWLLQYAREFARVNLPGHIGEIFGSSSVDVSSTGKK